MTTRFARILFLLALAVPLPLPLQAQWQEVELLVNFGNPGQPTDFFRYERSFNAYGDLFEETLASRGPQEVEFFVNSRTLWSYDDQRRPTEKLVQRLQDDWFPHERTVWTYAADDTYEVETLQRVEGNGNWSNRMRTSRTFDDEHRMISSLLEFWVNGAWQVGTNPSTGTRQSEWTTVEYSGLVSTRTFRKWSEGAWLPVWRISESEQSGSTPSTSVREHWIAGAWQPRTRTETLVVQEGNTSRHDSRIWSWAGNDWVPMSRLEEVSDQTKDERTGLVSAWSGEAWEPSSFYTRQVRSSERTTEMQYVMTENGWESRHRMEWTYNASGLISGQSTEVFLEGDWYHKVTRQWTYPVTTAVETNELPLATSFHVSPNPTSGRVTLHLEDRVRVNPRLDVFDMLGRSVTPSGAWDGGQTLDLGGLPKGVYFLRLRSEDRVERARVIVQ